VSRNALMPVRVLKDEDVVRVRYLDSHCEFELDATKPVAALHTVSVNDDATLVEVLDEAMLAVRQIDEFGNPQTVMLSPRMAVELSHVLNSFVWLGPTAVGSGWADGRDRE
jgi:hypothetical protein